MSEKLLRLFVLPSFALAAVACGSGDVITPDASSVDRTVLALTSPGGAPLALKALKGTYGASCKIHAGASWDLNLNDAGDRSLEIALNDTFANCPLTVTAIRVQAGASLVDYAMVPPIVLGLGYAAQPSSVNQPSPTILAFYGNLKLNGLAGPVYTNNFSLQLVYSDDALACGEVAPPAMYATVTAVATGSAVPPPNYDMTFDNLKLLVDANKVVQTSSTGNIVLKLPGSGPQPGEEWKLFDESSKCCASYTFAVIDDMYRNETPIAVGTISSSADVVLPWSAFGLAGQTLPKSRTIIVRHLDGGGVYSYELIQVLFPGPNPVS